MVPSAAIGIDVAAFFDTVKIMTGSVGPDAPPAANPGFQLGAIMGAAAVAGRDKLTLVVSPALKSFGAWVEQLIAESTGKQGKGIVPVDLEPLGGPEDYGDDRLFVHLHLDGDHDEDSHAMLAALKAAGHPVVTIGLARREDIGQEFVRWEIATAVAGAVLGIDPFDQPDVEDAKVQTRELIRAYEQSGSLGPERSFFEDRDFAFYGPEEPGGSDAVAILRSYLSPAAPPAYAAFLTYLERTAENEAFITRLRVALRDTKRVATLSGFGPRYLHSTGQLFKGGPKDGVFLEITRTAPDEISIPGSRASFAVVQAAQARGDMEVLEARGQRVLRVHLKDGSSGLHRLAEAIERAVAA
jgi:transaldolase/glucose-6-phosphate isomerase